MFKGQHTSVDQRLAELVAEVRGAVGGLDEDLLRGLVKPLARCCPLLPATVVFRAGIRGHIDSRTRQGKATLATGQTVTNLSSRSSGGTVEGLHGGREVVRLRF